MTGPTLSVSICTHNPREDLLAETLGALRTQAPLPFDAHWELLVIDNASTTPLADQLDLTWHPAARVVREDRLGLTHARFRAFREATGDIIVFVDDDNILAPDYLATVAAAFAAEEDLGAAGGRVLPRYEAEPPAWFAETGLDLACRDLGESKLEASWRDIAPAARTYPECAPIGAGMALRRDAYGSYVTQAKQNPLRAALGRRGTDLSSGEDNDMVMTLLDDGWRVSYLPALVIEHVIPATRLKQNYLERYARSSNRTWVQVLAIHRIFPWKPIASWTLGLRKVRAWWRLRAWTSPARKIAWHGACGQLEGRALIGKALER